LSNHKQPIKSAQSAKQIERFLYDENIHRNPSCIASCFSPLFSLTASLPVLAQQGDGTRVPISTNVFKPAKVAPTVESIRQLRTLPGFSGSVFASGLRNTIGFDWQPQTGELWGMDNGIDFLGDEVQPEELNKIEKGKQYGWPHIWGKDGVNPQSTPVGDMLLCIL
jgi:hypothetical protein